MAQYKPVTHVIFDLDGTLLDTEEVFTNIYTSVVERHGKKLTWKMRGQCLGYPEEVAMFNLIQELKLPLNVEEFQSIARTEFAQMMELGFENSTLKPGVEKLVNHLHNHKIPMAIGSSSKRQDFSKKTLKHRGIFKLFHHEVFFPDVSDNADGKPDPAVFLKCAKLFPGQPSPEEVLVIEDSPQGVEAAFQAKMQVVMIRDPRVEGVSISNATLVLRSLEEFKPEIFSLPPFTREDCGT